MKKWLNIFIALLFYAGCSAQDKKTGSAPEISPFAKDSFSFAQTLLDTAFGDHKNVIDGMTAILVPVQWGEEDFSKSPRTGIEFPCQCTFRNDTLSVVAALAWEGGVAYGVVATSKSTKTYSLVFGKNKSWKMADKVYKDEIEIPSQKNKLFISRPFPLKIDKLLYGWFDIESAGYVSIDNEGKDGAIQRDILRIFFSCRGTRHNIF